MTKFLDPKNDYAFKKVFGTEQNKKILRHFLNDILKTSIRELKFLKTVQEPEVAAKKQSIVDVLCKDGEGRQYIVEMQVAHSEAFIERAQFYACRAYASQLKKGQGYKFLRPVIFLAITDFVMFKEKKGYKSEHVILDKDLHTHELNGLSFTFLELPKFHKQLDELTTNTERWMYFFKHAAEASPEELEVLSQQAHVIGQAFHALDQFYWTDEEIATYEREQKSQMDAEALLLGAKAKGEEKGMQEGLQEGLKKGLQEGLRRGLKKGLQDGVKKGEIRGQQKAMRAVIQELLAMQMDVTSISRVTKLPPEEIEKLLEQPVLSKA